MSRISKLLAQTNEDVPSNKLRELGLRLQAQARDERSRAGRGAGSDIAKGAAEAFDLASRLILSLI